VTFAPVPVTVTVILNLIQDRPMSRHRSSFQTGLPTALEDDF